MKIKAHTDNSLSKYSATTVEVEFKIPSNDIMTSHLE